MGRCNTSLESTCRHRPAKRNHEFESNPLRHPVWRFSFSVVIRARRSILRPFLRGNPHERVDDRIHLLNACCQLL